MLELSAVSKHFGGTKALEDVDISLSGGEICGLVGHNGAGKSTLIKIIAGALEADRGQIKIGGNEVSFHSPRDAYNSGIRVIHQDAPLVPDLNSVENCYLGRHYPRKFGIIDKKFMRQTISRFAKEIAPDLDLDRPVAFLPTGEKQFVRLLKAVSDAGNILVLDEPTAALPTEDADIFFDVLKRLKARGTAILFVSHRLDEIAQNCDRAIVMSDGKKVEELTGKSLNVAMLIKAMGGASPKKNSKSQTPANNTQQANILEIEALTSANLRLPVNFKLKAGEIVTLYGLAGSGRSSLLQAIWGAEQSAGRMKLNGEFHAPSSPRDAVRAGISYVPSDRHRTGLFPEHNLIFNKTIPRLQHYRRFAKLPLPGKKREKNAFLSSAKIVSLIFGAPGHLAKTLSGGNQQKLIFSRWADRHSQIMLLDEPTEGIDISARASIKAVIRQMAKDGCGVLISTSDRDEALELGDRVAVFRDGALIKVFTRETANQDEIAACAQARTVGVEPEIALAR